MSDFWQDDPQDGAKFSWDEWFYEGLRALRKLLFRYDFGLPDAFWRHMQAAFGEFLAAMRILLKTIRHREQMRNKRTPGATHGSIDIDWDD